MRFSCPVEGCDKAYATSMGIYQHKRSKHPWLINQRARGYTRPAYHSKQEPRRSALEGLGLGLGLGPGSSTETRDIMSHRTDAARAWSPHRSQLRTSEA